MTKYKEALKRRGIVLEHDFPVIPFNDGNGTIEGRRVICKHNFIFVTTYYDEVGLVTDIYDKDFNRYPVLEEIPVNMLEKCTHFVIWDDMPTLRFCYDIDDNLIYIAKGVKRWI